MSLVDVICVVGARPNFMKIAPIARALDAAGVSRRVVHTEQHYDVSMSGVFFRDLGMEPPAVKLGVGSGTHAEQTARVMLAFEPVLRELRPRWVVVVGDVNSTVACALVAAKEGVPVAHVEAGLRSRDRRMPEEINRILTDQLADLCLTPSRDADANLHAEGVQPARILRVGNVMIDTLVWSLPRARATGVVQGLGLPPGAYALATIHRPSNVDDAESLARMVEIVARVQDLIPVVFPVHPRTAQRLAAYGLTERLAGVKLLPPLGYLECIALEESARLVLTDSGGMQEETTYLGVPCLTLRENTERPVTVEEGTNKVVGTSVEEVLDAVRGELDGGWPPRKGRRPALWDGRAAERIADCLSERLGRTASETRSLRL